MGISGSGGLEVGYAYDGANNRVEKTVNGVRTTYRVDPFSPVDNVPQVLVEEAGDEAVRYLYGLDLLGEVRAGTPAYYGYDALSIRLGLGEGGALTARYRYAPFGEVEGEGPAGYGFTGERWDGEVGLLYLRARYYRPAVGRFVSRDPARGEVNQPETLHPYVYAANRPTVLTDPAGMREEPGPGCYYYGMWLDIWLDVPRYWQLDPQWAGDAIGRCRVDCRCRPEEMVNGVCPGCDVNNTRQATIKDRGCLLTSASMVFAYYGSRLDPGQVNRCMGDCACDWCFRKGADDCSGGKARWVGQWWGGIGDIYRYLIWALTNGYPPLVEVDARTQGLRHWLVVQGVTGTGLNVADYWVIDPYDRTGWQLSHFTGLGRVAVYSSHPTIPPAWP